MDTERLIVSAPGKIILHGEHSVVYGKTAVALSLNLRTVITVSHTTSECVELSVPKLGGARKWSVQNLVQLQTTIQGDPQNPSTLSGEDHALIQQFLAANEEAPSVIDQISLAFVFLCKAVLSNLQNCSGLSVNVTSRLPIGAGLGSSASIAVCLAAALLKVSGALTPDNTNVSESNEELRLTSADLDLVNGWAFVVEQIFHGSPSGVDNCTCTYGGAVVYRNGQFTPMKVDLKLRILAVNTMVSRNTKEIISRVKSRKEKYSAIIDPILEAMDQVARLFETTLRDAQLSDANRDHHDIFEDLIDINQALLEALGVSHPKLKQIVSTSTKYGFHGKLTGAGGGGVAFVLLRPDTTLENVALLKQDLVEQGFQCWEVAVGGPGLELKKSSPLAMTTA